MTGTRKRRVIGLPSISPRLWVTGCDGSKGFAKALCFALWSSRCMGGGIDDHVRVWEVGKCRW